MTQCEFERLTVELMTDDKWRAAASHFADAFRANDSEFNAALDLIVQVTPETESERRIFKYLLFCFLKSLALCRIKREVDAGRGGSLDPPKVAAVCR
jgi:hypothetical protein